MEMEIGICNGCRLGVLLCYSFVGSLFPAKSSWTDPSRHFLTFFYNFLFIYLFFTEIYIIYYYYIL